MSLGTRRAVVRDSEAVRAGAGCGVRASAWLIARRVAFLAVGGCVALAAASSSIGTASPSGAIGRAQVNGLDLEGTLATDRASQFNPGSFSDVAISPDGSTAAYSDNTQDNAAGAVWVFSRSGGTWTLQAKIGPPDPNAHPQGGAVLFGSDFALGHDGNSLLISGSGPDGSSVLWTYRRSVAAWDETGEVTLPAGPFSLGRIVLSGDGRTLAMSGSTDSVGSGSAVFVYAQSAGGWAEQQQLPYPRGIDAANSFVGSLALSGDGDTAMVGLSNRSDASNLAYVVYTRSGGTWIERQEFDLAHAAAFGHGSLSDDGSIAVFPVAELDKRAVKPVVFSRAGSTWTQRPELEVVGKNVVQMTGAAVSGDGATVFTEGSYRGHTYVWGFAQRPSGAWVEQSETAIPDGKAPIALSADGSRLLVGTGSGAMLVYVVHGQAGAPSKLSVTLHSAPVLDLRKTHSLAFSVSASMPGQASARLRRGAAVVGTKTASLGPGTPSTLLLRLPKTLAAGVYRLSVDFVSGARHTTRTVTVRVTATTG